MPEDGQDPITFTDEQGRRKCYILAVEESSLEEGDDNLYATPEDLERAGYVPKDSVDEVIRKASYVNVRRAEAAEAFKTAYLEDTKAIHKQAAAMGLPTESLPSAYARLAAHKESAEADAAELRQRLVVYEKPCTCGHPRDHHKHVNIGGNYGDEWWGVCGWNGYTKIGDCPCEKYEAKSA